MDKVPISNPLVVTTSMICLVQRINTLSRCQYCFSSSLVRTHIQPEIPSPRNAQANSSATVGSSHPLETCGSVFQGLLTIKRCAVVQERIAPRREGIDQSCDGEYSKQ